MKRLFTRNKIGLAVLLMLFGLGVVRSPAHVILPVIGDFVWQDTNRNGIQDGDEPGVADVSVNLYLCDSTFVGSTTTDANGFYSFSRIPSQEYIVEFILPDGFVFTMQNQGGNDANDSDADPSTGRTDCIPTSYVDDLTWDAGIYRDCSVDAEVEGCVIIVTPPTGNDCKGKVIRMTLEYTGEGCDASSHSQDPKKVKCSGNPNAEEPVNIYVTNNKRKRNWGSALNIPVGGLVLVDAANGGKDHLDADTLVTIYGANSGVLLQEVKFHTSCSQPLSVGDQFGSVRLISLTTTEGGEVNPVEDDNDICIMELPATGADVEYTYTITNTGSSAITNVTVIDDTFGELPGSPIPFIAPGESVILTLIVHLTEETTNTVTVTVEAGCTAEATATITKAPPEPEECTTKVQAMLLEYIGPTVSGPVTVTIKADKFKDDLVIYNIAGDLVPGTTLSSGAENDWTIDATAHTTTDKKGNVKQCVELGAKTEISINGVKEVIHTSCSTPFVSGEPAPLDGRDIKGDPSPNWFVVDFRQK